LQMSNECEFNLHLILVFSLNDCRVLK
jgi:hypothetical protein